jgi:hypothetical protein
MQVRFGAPTFNNRLGNVGGPKTNAPSPAQQWRERAAACGFQHSDDALPAEIMAAEKKLAELAAAGEERPLSLEELAAIRKQHGLGWLTDMMAREKQK